MGKEILLGVFGKLGEGTRLSPEETEMSSESL